MIFGNSRKSEERNREVKECLSVLEGTPMYAYLPKRMSDGKYVWLQEYYIHADGFILHHDFNGGIQVSMGVFGSRESCGVCGVRSAEPERSSIRIIIEKPFDPPHQKQMNRFPIKEFFSDSEEWKEVMGFYRRRLVDLLNDGNNS